jgi:hypothetical protein
MAVRADQLTLRDLRQDGLAAKASQIADLADLLATRQMIPSHSRVMKEATAVRAWRALFEFVMPAHDVIPTLPLLRH